jgi:hypothetical protein
MTTTMRVLGLVALFAAAGCGDDTTMMMTPAAMDQAMPVLDLTIPGHACGATSCTGSCTACVLLGGGLCGVPCNTAMPSACSSGVCNAATGGDGGLGNVVLDGDCSAYNGFCG